LLQETAQRLSKQDSAVFLLNNLNPLRTTLSLYQVRNAPRGSQYPVSGCIPDPLLLGIPDPDPLLFVGIRI
jgi:hypothetical protein